MSQDIKEKFLELDELFWSAIVDRELSHETKDRIMHKKSFTDIQKEAKQIKEEIESLVQKRLQLDQAL